MKYFFIVGSLLVPFCEPAFSGIIVRHHPAHFVTIGAGATSWTDPDGANLVGLWYLQETVQPSGALDDGSTNNFDADAQNYPDWDGVTNTYHHHQSSEYWRSGTNAGNEVGTSTNLSISCWINPDDAGGSWFGIANIGNLGNSQGNMGGFVITDEIRVRVRDTTANTLSFAFTNEGIWSHFVMTWDGLNIRGYIDGIIQGTQAHSGSQDSSGMRLHVRAYYGSGAVVDGSVDSLHFYSRTLASNEILTASGVDRLTYDITGYSDTNNLLAFYEMNQVLGAGDDSGNYFEMASRPTFDNAPTFGEIVGTNLNGRVQYAVRGDGSDDRLLFTDLHDSDDILNFGTNDFTIMAWINIDAHKQFNAIMGRGFLANLPGWGIYVDNNGVLGGQVRSSGSPTVVTNDTVLSTGTWYHVAFVRDVNTKTVLWVDGVEQADTVSENVDTTGTKDIFLMYSASASPFDGLMANVRIYNTVITNILDIYNNTLMPNGDIEARLSNP